MKRCTVILFFLMAILLIGCSNQTENTSLEKSVSESTEYVLDDFEETSLQEIENHGITLKVPASWQVSNSEETDGTSVIANFDYGVMSVISNRTDDELNLNDMANEYKAFYPEDSITSSREERLSDLQMEVFDWNDESNGNKIHGTTYLFVAQRWNYNITFSTYEEVSYEQQLLSIMDTFIFDETNIDEVPLHITELFKQYDTVISSGSYDISLGEKVGIDDREEDYTYYKISLCPSDPDIISYPYVQFYSDDEYTSKSFTIYDLDKCTNAVKKEIIYCTLAATNPDMNEESITELQLELINSYDGYGQSKVVETEKYKYFIATSSVSSDMIFEVVAKEEINIPVDKGLYLEYSIDEMQAELNIGEKAIINGSVEYEVTEEYTNALRIVCGDKQYFVHYSPTAFPDEFHEGEQYVFYGTICEACDSESGCLSLDYYEISNASSDKNDGDEEFKTENDTDTSKISVNFSKDYIDEDRLYLKVYVKNTSDKMFTGDIHVFFYSADGKEQLGSDLIIVDKLAPGQESWSNVTIDNYDGTPKLELEFTEPCFTEVEMNSDEIDAEATENTKNSYHINFDGVSWYSDITEIIVYTDGRCVVTIKSEAKEDGQFYASTIWGCGNEYGVESVQVVDSNGTIQAIYP